MRTGIRNGIAALAVAVAITATAGTARADECGWYDWVWDHNVEGGFVGWVPLSSSYTPYHEGNEEWWTVSYIVCHDVQDEQCLGQWLTEWWHCPLY